MAEADYIGVVDAVGGIEYIDITPYFVFSIPKPTVGLPPPIEIPENDYVFYYDLTTRGAEAVVSIVTAAFISGEPLQLGLIKTDSQGLLRAEKQNGRFVQWVQIPRRSLKPLASLEN